MNDSPGKSARRLNLFALAVVLLAIVAGFRIARHTSLQSARKQNCFGNMVAISLCGRMWSKDNGEGMPHTFTVMSNLLVSPKVLFCLADPGAQKLQEQMSTWDRFDERRCSYEIVNPGIPESNPTNVFVRCKAHGHLGYVDGSVFDGRRRLSGYEAKGGTPAPRAPSKAN